ncbi:MAG: MBL fold metallo-hydrolase [Bacteroidia bacterium]|nr:MBL fold metallo-hydrolase [Bacteroidia bacterium]
MTITFIGTASGVPVPHRRHSCVLVEHGEVAELIDAGEGCAAGLVSLDRDTQRIRSVWVSHTHADHVSGLPLLLQHMHLRGRTEHLDILVPPGREPWFLNWLQGMYIFQEKWSFPFCIKALEHITTAGGLRIQPVPNTHLDKSRELAARHGVPAQAWSFVLMCDETSVLLSSDIAGIADVEEYARNVQLAILDVAHVPMDDVFRLAERCTDLEIFCTHIPPELETKLVSLCKRSVQDHGGRIHFAEDGMRVAPGRG